MKLSVKVFFISVVLVFLGACNKPSDTQTHNAPKVKVDRVMSMPGVLTRDFSGVIAAINEINLAFRVGGPIKSILVKPGDRVKKGQLLAQMDERDYLIQFAVAKAEYEKVTSETKRVSELYKRNSVTEVDYQKAVAGEKMIQAQLDHARDQINDTKLYAPFSGIIQKTNFEEGELVNTGMPVVSILNTDRLEIAVDIPAKLFAQRNGFSRFYAVVTTLPGDKIPLSLEKFEPKANSSQLYQVVFCTTSDYPKQLLPGMEAKIVFELNQEENTDFYVPTRAIFYDNGQACIWVLNTADSTVLKTNIITNGIYKGEFTKVKRGLKGNEVIVVAGIHSLSNKLKVQPMPPVSKTNIGGLL